MNPHPVLTPFQLGPHALRNRAVVAPLSRVSAPAGGIPTAAMARYYEEYARGGFGLIITEGTYTDAHFAQAYTHQPGIIHEAQVAGWRAVVERIHAAGAKVFCQLMHAGALSQCLSQTAAPSAVQPLRTKLAGYGGEGPWPVPKAMTQAEIQQAVQGFAASARRAAAAGFDGVEIHGANGYLIDQFLSDTTNRRRDRYGDSVAARATLALEVIAAVKAAVPPGFTVGLRLSQGKVNDFDYRWPGGRHTARTWFSLLAQTQVDYLHFASEGTGYQHSCVLEDGTVLPQLARAMVGVPVMVNGGMHAPDLAAQVLQAGHGDLAALGTGAIANPDWPNKLAAGEPIQPFQPAMLQPEVTIEATWAHRRRQASLLPV
ncbi:oxidoreductase [Acanthopleuribacter pedis]|uniref:NADH:flavin oxidoreductase n=1 Tax=Acanthopleuribacter pedis TaxID=442870 RepID=A0A8J7Q9V5_9BACT|nr:NADH:flavin oxidoreductase [Acanthopleuribacter pedis]MBO1321391.1 NADH:flavin oxidoreductase [Acanthopleuribacter pedis]